MVEYDCRFVTDGNRWYYFVHQSSEDVPTHWACQWRGTRKQVESEIKKRAKLVRKKVIDRFAFYTEEHASEENYLHYVTLKMKESQEADVFLEENSVRAFLYKSEIMRKTPLEVEESIMSLLREDLLSFRGTHGSGKRVYDRFIKDKNYLSEIVLKLPQGKTPDYFGGFEIKKQVKAGW